MVYVSRYSNPELKSGKYTAVRISIGAPKWPLGYEIAGELNCLMPWGMLNKYSHEEFVPKYRAKLDSVGAERIAAHLSRYEQLGKPVVLLCYEDVRVPGKTCHRTTFAEWWYDQTGERIEELPDPTTPKLEAVSSNPAQDQPKSGITTKTVKATKKTERLIREREMERNQLSIFDALI